MSSSRRAAHLPAPRPDDDVDLRMVVEVGRACARPGSSWIAEVRRSIGDGLVPEVERAAASAVVPGVQRALESDEPRHAVHELASVGGVPVGDVEGDFACSIAACGIASMFRARVIDDDRARIRIERLRALGGRLAVRIARRADQE